MVSNARAGIWFLLIIVIGIYAYINFFPERIFGTFASTYIVQPALWFLLMLTVLLILPRQSIKGEFRVGTPVFGIAIILGMFHLSIQLIAGLFTGFGDSPYNFDPRGIIFNFVFVIAALVGMEVARAWLVRHLAKKHVTAAIFLSGLVFALLVLPVSKLTGLAFTTESIQTVNGDIIPALAQSLLATVLAYYGGARASIVYLGILQAFWWFSPVLPDFSWSIKGLINTVIPIMGFVLVQNYVNNLRHRISRRAPSNDSSFPLGWVAVTTISVVFIWFSVGIFPVRPSLIISGSMTPEYNVGDVVVIAEVPIVSIKVGDVIRFQEGEIAVMHRVVAIDEIGKDLIFTTKGDANDAVDSAPVVAEQVKGKAAFTVPKIGWIAIFVRSLFGL
ncbi:MAG: signal peptidase I [Dehalogenimonas sp.]|uniref:Signal peptidase I n=1 Tax=Candidatus Dehalogenimonas loeffleri TaxID=3127115 RepID=A0ABZ2J7K5_9CHLR|nr:signal peptidase I [Dehalogenimonas sp.]